jgi:hypothetical protein
MPMERDRSASCAKLKGVELNATAPDLRNKAGFMRAAFLRQTSPCSSHQRFLAARCAGWAQRSLYDRVEHNFRFARIRS